MTTFDQSLDAIAALAKRFGANHQAYRAPNYKEAQARNEFIDHMFIALGWDVHHTQPVAPQYQEVIIEASLEIEGALKAPDYEFRIAQTTKFYVEAKKPGVSIKDDPEPARQLRRYAWTKKLPLSLLTDFEELAIYDGRTPARVKDKASTARINFYTFGEYPDRWREVWDLFSREAVRAGSFEQYVQADKRRGTTEVDAEFLKEIEGWRDALARNFALRNADLSTDELNDAVQRTIDRIIFLRMAEDRGIEPYEQLKHIASDEDAYAELIRLSRNADAKYNSGLFDFSAKGDRLTPKLALDDKVLDEIVTNLYPPQSPYAFSVMPTEILGNVYEQFLGKVIRLTGGHRAKIEEKPEVKKAGGVVYTPTYIVEYIVKNTVGKLVEGKSPGQLKNFRVLDPAVGSGSFVLGAYSHLLDHYLKWYTEHEPEKHKKEVWRFGEAWRLTSGEKKRILTTHIFGVDIDRQAVEVTKLSLLLKVLEGESDETLGPQMALIPERALPNLDDNIKCGNSLIGPDYFAGRLMPDAEEMKRVNPFDWEAEFPEVFQRKGAKDAEAQGGFDCVIGNPPYIRIQTMKEWAPLEVEAYKGLYTAASAGNYDIYVVFVEKGLSLLNKKGMLGFILPHKFFNAKYGEPLRGLISQGKHLAHVVHFGDQQVFTGATTYTCLMFLNKAVTQECHFVKVDDLNAWRNSGAATEGTIPAANITATDWNFAVGKGAALFEKLSKMPVRLSDVTTNIFQGIVTSADPIYTLAILKEMKQGYQVYSKYLDAEVEIEYTFVKSFLKGHTIEPFGTLPKNNVLLFPYDKGGLVEWPVLEKSAPLTAMYLRQCKAFLAQRESGKMNHAQWYGYVYPKNLYLFQSAKLVVSVISKTARYTLDTQGAYFTGGGNGPYYGILVSQNYQPEYILALLNSHLLDFYLHNVSSPFRGGYWSYGKRFIEQLPIRIIDFNDPKDVARHDRMVTLVQQMLDLHKRLASARTEHERTLLQRQIDATDKEIDRLVYELYDLTDEEIRIVEGM